MEAYDTYLGMSAEEAILVAVLLVSMFFAMSMCILITCNYKYYQDEIWKEKLTKIKFKFNEKSQIIIAVFFVLVIIHLVLLWFI